MGNVQCFKKKKPPRVARPSRARPEPGRAPELPLPAFRGQVIIPNDLVSLRLEHFLPLPESPDAVVWYDKVHPSIPFFVGSFVNKDGAERIYAARTHDGILFWSTRLASHLCRRQV
jgi:hypothetical protein